MIFLYNGVRCAFDGQTISYQGVRGLIPIGTVLHLNGEPYRILKNVKSDYGLNTVNIEVEKV